MKVYDFCEPWLDGSVILRNLIDQNLLLCALFWRLWDVPCADIVPTRYTSAKQTTKNKTRFNFLKKSQSCDDFCDKMCTYDVLCQIDRSECVQSAAGRATWSVQNLYSLYWHHTNFFEEKILFFFEKLKNKRSPAAGRIAGAPRKAIWAPKMSNCGKETSDTQKL